MKGRDLLEADAMAAFSAFAQHRNFTRAAAALHMSEPALHAKIRKLGVALGVDLYEREGRQLRLTSAGERLAAYATDNRLRLDEFMLTLHHQLPTLTIAAGRGTLRWVIADPIRQLTRRGRRVRIITASREAALTAIGDGDADLAVVAHDPPPPDCQSIEIASYRQNLVIDARHPLTNRARIRLSALNGLHLVVPTPGRAQRRSLDHALREADVTWHVGAEIDGWDLLVHLVSLGMGAAIVNGCVDLPPGLTAIPIIDLPQVRYWAAWLPDRDELVQDALTYLNRQ